MVKRKVKEPTGIMMYLNSLNNSKFLTGLIVILLNIGGKYVSVNLSKNQETYFKNAVGHQIIIFAACWMATRDIILSIILTGIFIVLTQHLFNEKSKFCIIPNNWRTVEKSLDLNNDGKIDKDEINKAIQILEKVKRSK